MPEEVKVNKIIRILVRDMDSAIIMRKIDYVKEGKSPLELPSYSGCKWIIVDDETDLFNKQGVPIKKWDIVEKEIKRREKLEIKSDDKYTEWKNLNPEDVEGFEFFDTLFEKPKEQWTLLEVKQAVHFLVRKLYFD